MELMSYARRQCIGLCLGLTMSAAGFAQHLNPQEIVGGPLSGPMPFVNAPFSADAITTVSHMLRDGTRLEQSTTARYYRDSAGRVRVELLMEGLRAPKTMSERHMRVTIVPMTVVHPPAPSWVGYSVDPVTRTTRYSQRGHSLATGGGVFLEVPIGGVRFLAFHRAQDMLRSHRPELGEEAFQHESLGTRRIAGVDATGYRTTASIPALLFRNEDPIELVDEQWESPELHLVIYARYSDSHGGVIDYRLTNLRREDPPPELFVVPPDYTLDSPSGSREDPIHSSQDGRWVLDGLAWSASGN